MTARPHDENGTGELSPWWPLASFVAVALASLAWLYSEGKVAFPLDDAYTVVHTLEVQRQGHDPNFPHAPLLAGCTSTVFVSLAMLLRPLAGSARALEWLNALAMGLLAAAVVRASVKAHARPWFVAAGAALSVVVGRSTLHLTNGLETGLACATVAWVLALHREDERARGVAVPLLCGVGPYVRPELALLSLLALADRALARRGGSRDEQLRGLGRDAAAALLAASPWAAVDVLALGTPVPTTIAAKRAFFAESCEPLAQRASVVGFALAQFIVHVGPLAAAALLVTRDRVGRIALLFAAGTLGVYFVELPGALHHNRQRYMQPIVAVFLLAPAIAFASERTRRLASALQAVGLAYALLALPSHLSERAVDRAFSRQELRGLAAWTRQRLPRGAVVLVHDIGYLSATTALRLVDLVGLRSPENVAVHQSITLASCGARRGDAVAQIATRSGATHVVVLDTWDRLFSITSGLQRHGFALTPLRTVPGGYSVFAIEPRRSP